MLNTFIIIINNVGLKNALFHFILQAALKSQFSKHYPLFQSWGK